MKRAWSASEQAVSSKKTRPLIGQPAKSANQRSDFLVGKCLNICPLCSFQKTVTLVSICVFSTEEVHNHTGFIWNVMNFHPLTTQISLLKQRQAPFTVLYIIYFKTFSVDFTCKLFSKSILSSQKVKSSKKVWKSSDWRPPF